MPLFAFTRQEGSDERNPWHAVLRRRALRFWLRGTVAPIVGILVVARFVGGVQLSGLQLALAGLVMVWGLAWSALESVFKSPHFAEAQSAPIRARDIIVALHEWCRRALLVIVSLLVVLCALWSALSVRSLQDATYISRSIDNPREWRLTARSVAPQSNRTNSVISEESTDGGALIPMAILGRIAMGGLTLGLIWFGWAAFAEMLILWEGRGTLASRAKDSEPGTTAGFTPGQVLFVVALTLSLPASLLLYLFLQNPDSGRTLGALDLFFTGRRPTMWGSTQVSLGVVIALTVAVFALAAIFWVAGNHYWRSITRFPLDRIQARAQSRLEKGKH